jgi:hypothetical protein
MPANSPRLARHPGLTLTVYRITADGKRLPLRSTRYRPGPTTAPEISSAWAPCRCLRCSTPARPLDASPDFG